MRVSNNQLTGAAGEALVSFLIHHELRWVHRGQQQPIDCGVDGQIQVVDNGVATRLHLGTQVGFPRELGGVITWFRLGTQG